jgi:hypothetical protein
VYIHHLLPHPADPSLVVRLGLYRRGYLYGFRPVEFLSYGYRLWVLFGTGDVSTGISNGGLDDREGIQSLGDCFHVWENGNERAFERVIDLLYRGDGGLKTLPKILPAQLHINARGIDLKKRTQHITGDKK